MRNSSLVQRFCAEDLTGLKFDTEDTAAHLLDGRGREAFSNALKLNRKV